MNIITDNNLPIMNKTIISIGNFDGVHIGHRLLIETLASKSTEKQLEGIVFTFAQNPKNLLTSGVVKYLTGTEDKMRFLSEYGAKNIYFADFNEIGRLTPEEFTNNILIGKFNADTVICGYDFRFGKGRSGSAEDLGNLLERHGIKCIVTPAVYYEGRPVSSTEIRRLLSEGDVERAASLLGRPYCFTLPVIYGRQIGRSLGFPTINQVFPEYRVIPAYGVYAVECEANGKIYNGIANIGVRPTVSKAGDGPVCETHLFGFSGDLYNHTVRVSLKKRLRQEIKFETLEQLKNQIQADMQAAEKYFLKQ
jgi:riboflavin kinase/FMN adenylyltransferase